MGACASRRACPRAGRDTRCAIATARPSYEIAVRQVIAGTGDATGVVRVTVDDVLQADAAVHLVDDRLLHRVVVEVRAALP